MTKLYNKTEVKEKRRTLRKSMPPAEVILWSKLRGKHMKGYKFRRQYSVGPYIIDFYVLSLNSPSRSTENRISSRDLETVIEKGNSLLK
jgi:hypothetical protein